MSYLNFSNRVREKEVQWEKWLVVKPIIPWKMNSMCQIDLIDMPNAQQDGDYKCIYIIYHQPAPALI